jgi:hypothetical protein
MTAHKGRSAPIDTVQAMPSASGPKRVEVGLLHGKECGQVLRLTRKDAVALYEDLEKAIRSHWPNVLGPEPGEEYARLNEAIAGIERARDWESHCKDQYRAQRDELREAVRLALLNARTAVEYTERERNDAKAAARLANIMGWPGFVALRDAVAKLERGGCTCSAIERTTHTPARGCPVHWEGQA